MIVWLLASRGHCLEQKWVSRSCCHHTICSPPPPPASQPGTPPLCHSRLVIHTHTQRWLPPATQLGHPLTCLLTQSAHSHKHTLTQIQDSRHCLTHSCLQWPKNTLQGLCQDLETGCPKLAIVKFWGVYFFRGNLNIFRKVL